MAKFQKVPGVEEPQAEVTSLLGFWDILSSGTKALFIVAALLLVAIFFTRRRRVKDGDEDGEDWESEGDDGDEGDDSTR